MVELQALERVHRLGQTRDVLITRYIIRDSFENVSFPIDTRNKKLISTIEHGSLPEKEIGARKTIP
jgi:SNF2 family DNA or RNA helicase